MKKFVEDCLAGRRIHPGERVASSVRECGAKAEHLLKFLAGIEIHHILSRALTGFPGERRPRLITQFPACDVNLDLRRCGRTRGRQSPCEFDSCGGNDSARGQLQKVPSALLSRHASSPGKKSNQ